MIKKLIIKGVSYTYLRQFLSIVLGLISLPLMLNYFGVTIYAIWVLISSIIVYLSNISFGIPNAMMALVAKEPCDNLKHLILKKSFYLLLMISAVAAILFLIVINLDKDWIGSLLGSIDDAYILISINVFIIYVLLAIAKLPLSLYTQFFIGMNKVYLSEIYTIVTLIVNFLALIITIYLKFDMLMFVILICVSQLLVALISVIHVKLSYASLKLEGESIQVGLNKKILQSGLSFFQVGIAAGLVWSTDNLVISHFLSVDDVTPYSIAFKIFTYMFIFSATINAVIAPVYGNAYAVGDWNRIKKYSTVILDALVVTGGLVWILLLFFSKEFILLWTHNEGAFGGYLLFFSLGFYCYVLSYVNTFATVVYALNWAKHVLKIVWAEALVNLCLSVLLVQYLGVGGVALATALSALLTAFFYLPKVINKVSNHRVTYDYTYLKKHFSHVLFPAVLISIGSIYMDNVFLKIILFLVVIIGYIGYSWCLLSEEYKLVIWTFLKIRRIKSWRKY